MEPPVDIEMLDKLQADIGGEPEIMRELIDSYLGEVPTLLDLADRSIAAKDLRTLARAAHTVKSTSHSFGAMTLYRLAREVEKLALEGEPEAMEMARDMRPEFERVRAVLLRRR